MFRLEFRRNSWTQLWETNGDRYDEPEGTALVADLNETYGWAKYRLKEV